ncbi:MAG TPA: BrnA antitoxin family protein [Acidobacteriaceae bacterium]|nr:BrnA antitoxin family protein [Acidobacteriaceae bacterium]
MPKIVRKTMAEAKVALAGRQDELKKLRKMRDRGIDLSELPELTETFWQNAVPNPFYRPVKKQITLRIDADILAWLRQQGPEGYQSRLNALLRSVMLRDLESKRKRA